MRPLVLCLVLSTPSPAADLVPREWTVSGVTREALVVRPKVGKPNAPLVFVFHGHGGTARHAARTMPVPDHWPEAVCVFPQGLKTPGRLTDPDGKKSGWQAGLGDQGDRDLAFFDAMLATAKAEFGIDPKRVYATGHSNGGAFTYLLGATRGEAIAALAPSAATGPRTADAIPPKPLFHVLGEADPLVRPAWQRATIARMKTVNGVTGPGVPWHDVKGATVYQSQTGPPVVVYAHPGDHTYPAEATAQVARFFKEHMGK
jgi:polyhydroxybutyrate depolymerase